MDANGAGTSTRWNGATSSSTAPRGDPAPRQQRQHGRDRGRDRRVQDLLYRYFVDKNDLTTAVMMRFAQTTLIPNMAAALSSNLDGYELTREIIWVYVETVASSRSHTCS